MASVLCREESGGGNEVHYRELLVHNHEIPNPGSNGSFGHQHVVVRSQSVKYTKMAEKIWQNKSSIISKVGTF